MIDRRTLLTLAAARVATAAANPSFELTLRTRTDKGVATLREKFNPAE